MKQPYVFDGKKFSQNKLQDIKREVLDLNTKGVFLKLATLIIGSDPASRLYVNLKKKKAEEIGIEVDIYNILETFSKKDVYSLLSYLNKDPLVNGIMIQLPIPGKLSEFKEEFINLIDIKKDVDGLRKDSIYIHPTALAIYDILEYAKLQTKSDPKTVCILGKTGMVGRSVAKILKNEKFKLIDDSINADVLISATGKEKIVSKDMVKSGVIAIDVGSPAGDIDFANVYEKTSFITPVPGGVGPVTIASLLENIVLSDRIQKE